MQNQNSMFSIHSFIQLLLAFLLSACVSFPEAPSASVTPSFEDDIFISIDGARLGLQRWEAENPTAIIVALHGMNDYSYAFNGPAAWWAANHNISTYAIDQRGFGRSPNFGHWPGEETLIADLRAALAAARRKHPKVPLYAMGHSMGAGVIIAASAESSLDAEGLILAAPGVWNVPAPYRLAANVAATFTPGKTLTGERADRQATDNIPILREMAADPLMIKETRLDAVVGVTRVMGSAYSEAKKIDARVLYLMGEKDEIIPLNAMEKTAMRLSGDVTFRRYPQGWHLLFRDLQSEKVWRDVASWVKR
ncbi:alpha/beta fold hydrolase [Hyphococcus flavus]|uniref:Alpha/beta fold hydrolase n=1 Tax=Hyphococcus flavus TaxID=1866326 RepID=A0AAF0CG87_9PROT|nr:alpha/beta fold hydrolase [Hyphococcus flavus]WDI30432.1 alpha/beta fold hydrolase [Hyphococcus flavus]